ncbi:MAG: hypothetical protein ACXAD7_03490, partial [Candidatus Kariarchaeaceae archaeon]
LPPIDGLFFMEIDTEKNINFSYSHYLSSGDIFDQLTGCQYVQQLDQTIFVNRWYLFTKNEIEQFQICA